MKGSTYKRCKCPPRYSAQGKRLACPKRHGTWYYIIDVPLSAEMRAATSRQYLKRGGLASEEAANAELRRVSHLLELPDHEDDEGRLQLAALIREHYKRYGRLPEYEEVRQRLRVGLSLTRPQTTGEWLEEWLAGKRNLARNTQRSYEGHIQLHLAPHLGQIPLDKLRRAHIQAAYDKTLAANAGRQRTVGPATIRRVHATLRAALNAAVAEGRIPGNPAVHVELVSGKRPKPVVWTRERVIEWMRTGKRPKVSVWTPIQTGAFLDYAAGDRLYAYYHLLVFRGPRRGEGIGLRWPNLDLDTGTMDVTEQIIQVGWETEVTAPKSDSDGLVALDATTVAILRAHHRRQHKERVAWGEAWTNTGYVFTTETGQPVHPDYVSRHFVRLVRYANKLRVGSQGPAVCDVQRALAIAPSGVFGRTPAGLCSSSSVTMA